MEDKKPTVKDELESVLVQAPSSDAQLPALVKSDTSCAACAGHSRRGSMTAWIFRREKHTCSLALKQSEQRSKPIPGGLEERIAQQFGEKYEVLGLLGQGGMGAVYKVRDRQLDALFAIKVLRTEFATESGAVKRFEQEAVSASQLTHPNLVAVYQHGVMDQAHGEPFLVMDYVEGDSLASLITRLNYLPVPRALEIFIQTGDAVNHAHSKGLLHRDLKPSNVLIAESENGSDFVKLVDFGIAKILPVADMQNPALTQTGELLGSPLYMSPEQCLGELLDVRSDIYSLGCLMYEALSGKPPFSAANPIKIIFKHLNEQAPAIRRPLSGHEIPAELEAIVLRCLEKNPADRYQTVAELTADLILLREGKKPKWKKQGVRKNTLLTKSFGLAMASSLTVTAIAAGLAWFAMTNNHNGGLQAAPAATAAIPAPPASPKNVLIDSCTREIANHPRDPNWYFMRGTAYRETGDYPKALQDFGKALALNPNNVKEILRARAWTYNQQLDYKKALADCNAALKIDPNYEEAYISRSRAYTGLGNPEAGLADAERGVRLNNADCGAYWNRASCKASLGQHDAAIEDFGKALKLQPHELNILIGRSRSYAKLGEWQKAIDDLSTILAANPRDYCRLIERADLYNRIGQSDKALADANMTIALAPADFRLGPTVRGDAERLMGHIDEAMKDYLRTVQVDNRDADAWKGIGDVWMARKQYDKAVESYSKAIDYGRLVDKMSVSIRYKSAYREGLEGRAEAYELLGKKELAHQDQELASRL